MKNVIFVTGNPAKAEYFSRLIGFPVDHQKIELEEIQSTDMQKITEDKARRAFEIVQSPLIVEDIGLYFEAWGNMPGPFIKFFVEQENGLANICKMLDGFSSRRAKTVVLTTYYDGTNFKHFLGGAMGEISPSPRGEGGFGYDAIWCVDGYNGRTRAEISKEEDDQSYIDARPMTELREFFKEYYE